MEKKKRRLKSELFCSVYNRSQEKRVQGGTYCVCKIMAAGGGKQNKEGVTRTREEGGGRQGTALKGAEDLMMNCGGRRQQRKTIGAGQQKEGSRE
jgi:hypothetical protein